MPVTFTYAEFPRVSALSPDKSHEALGSKGSVCGIEQPLGWNSQLPRASCWWPSMPASASDSRCPLPRSPVTEGVLRPWKSRHVWLRADATQPTQGRDAHLPVHTARCQLSVSVRAAPRETLFVGRMTQESANEFALHRRQRAWNITAMRKTSQHSCSTAGAFKEPLSAYFFHPP